MYTGKSATFHPPHSPFPSSSSSLSHHLNALNKWKTYTLPFPFPYSKIHNALLTSVTNAPAIRDRLIAASVTLGPEGDELRAKVHFAFLDASLVRPSSLRVEGGVLNDEKGRFERASDNGGECYSPLILTSSFPLNLSFSKVFPGRERRMESLDEDAQHPL